MGTLKRRLAICATVLVMLAAAASAQPPEVTADAQDANYAQDSQAKALEILKQADAATKKVKSVRFLSSLEPSGIAVNFVKAAKGEGVMEGWNTKLGIPMRFHGSAETRAKDGERVRLEGGGDGEAFFLINHSTKKGYEDPDPAVMGTIGDALRGIGMLELVHEAPFDDELGSEISYVGEEKVAGVLCDKVNVVYSGGQGESTWFFSREDHLPRRRLRHFDTPDGKGAIDLVISEFEVAPEIDPKIFRMHLPAGYERVDDFAP